MGDFDSSSKPASRETGSAASAMRYWYLDTLRAALMIGGVFFHAALPYASMATWRVKDPASLFFFDLIVVSLSSFRMPAFFFIAGFFASMLFLRNASKGPSVVVKRRIVSLGVPFLTMAVLVQPLQYSLKLVQEDRLSRMVPTEFVGTYMASGAYISHLWFLLNLIAYFVLVGLALSSPFARRMAKGLLQFAWVEKVVSYKANWALLGVAGVIISNKTIGPLGISGVYEVAEIVLYLPFFISGALSFLDIRWLEAFLRLRIFDVLLLVALACIRSFVDLEGRASTLVSLVSFYLLGFMITVLLVRLCRAKINFFSPLQQKLVDASFSIYLFHHICVIAASVALLRWTPHLPPFAKYAIVVSVSCALPYAVHRYLIAPFPRVRMLFNGRRESPSLLAPRK